MKLLFLISLATRLLKSTKYLICMSLLGQLFKKCLSEKFPICWRSVGVWDRGRGLPTMVNLIVCFFIEAISSTLSGWNYNVTDFTIYDEFCDCNEALLQSFYCDGPSKGFLNTAVFSRNSKRSLRIIFKNTKSYSLKIAESNASLVCVCLMCTLLTFGLGLVTVGLVLQTAGNLATINSEMITSSNPECYLSLVMTTTFRTYAGVTILSKHGTKFRVFSENREGG